MRIKRFLTILMVAVILVFSVNFAFADVDVEVELENDNTATATGGDATATGGDATATVGDISNNNANSLNNQNNINNRNDNLNMNRNDNLNMNRNDNLNQNWNNSRAASNLNFKNEAATNFVTASTLQNFVVPIKPSTPEGWKILGCEYIVSEFKLGQLRRAAEGASFMKKRGTFWFALLTDDVEYSILSSRNANLGDETIVRLMVKVPKRLKSDKLYGEAEGVGRYGAPLGQIMAATIIGLVERTGVTDVIIYWDYLLESTSMGNTVGLGTVGSGTEKNAAGSVAIGAAGSTTYSLTSIAYRVKVQAFSNMSGDYFSCEEPPIYVPPAPPVVKPEPKPAPAPQVKACDPSSIFTRIEELKQRIKECTRWCLNNLQLRSKLAEAYVDLYQCTEDKRYLNSAIEQFKIAERNYFRGHDIRANQAEADRLIAQDYYYWSGCINVLYGPDAADRFAAEKRVEKVPQL